MSNRRYIAILGAAVFSVLLVARLPASIATSRLPPTVVASNPSGTLWRGQSAHVQINVNGQWLALGSVDWSLHPLGFLLGDAVTLRSSWGSQRLDLAAGIGLNGDVTVSDATIRADISWVRSLLPLFIAGDLKADIETLRVSASGTPVFLSGRVLWEDAAWQAVGGDVSLGTYAIDLMTGEQGVSGTVVTLKGALELKGQFALDDSRYSVAADL